MEDQELSDPLHEKDIEDEETGETGDEKKFTTGNKVFAPWSINGEKYEGIIIYENGIKFKIYMCILDKFWVYMYVTASAPEIHWSIKNIVWPAALQN